MPIYRANTTGFKNPPVFTLDGRGPPKSEKMNFFTAIVPPQDGFILYVLNGWKDNKARNVLIYGIVLYAAEVLRERTYS